MGWISQGADPGRGPNSVSILSLRPARLRGSKSREPCVPGAPGRVPSGSGQEGQGPGSVYVCVPCAPEWTRSCRQEMGTWSGPPVR